MAKTPKYPYSPLETVALDVLKDRRKIRTKDKPINTLDLIERIYANREAPYNARQSVVALMNGLQRKVEANEEKFRVVITERGGPNPISYWLAGK